MKNLIDDTIPQVDVTIEKGESKAEATPIDYTVETNEPEVIDNTPSMTVTKGGGDKTLINVLIIAGVLLLLFALLKMYFDSKDKIENS